MERKTVAFFAISALTAAAFRALKRGDVSIRAFADNNIEVR